MPQRYSTRGSNNNRPSVIQNSQLQQAKVVQQAGCFIINIDFQLTDLLFFIKLIIRLLTQYKCHIDSFLSGEFEFI